jgi:hypothetical protein
MSLDDNHAPKNFPIFYLEEVDLLHTISAVGARERHFISSDVFSLNVKMDISRK